MTDYKNGGKFAKEILDGIEYQVVTINVATQTSYLLAPKGSKNSDDTVSSGFFKIENVEKIQATSPMRYSERPVDKYNRGVAIASLVIATYAAPTTLYTFVENHTVSVEAVI